MWCFSGSGLMRRCFAEADMWEDLLLKQTHERLFLLRHSRRHMVFGQSIMDSEWQSCICSSCNTLLVFTDSPNFIKKRQRTSRGIWDASCYFHGFGRALWCLMDWTSATDWSGLLLLIHVWWTADNPDNEDKNHSKKLLPTNLHPPPCPLNHLLLLVVGRREGMLKHLRTLTIIGFLKNLSLQHAKADIFRFLIFVCLPEQGRDGRCGQCAGFIGQIPHLWPL